MRLRLLILAMLLPAAVNAAPRTSVVSVTPLPNRQVRVCWRGVPGAVAYWIQGSDPVENLFIRATTTDTICRAVNLFGTADCQVNFVTVSAGDDENGQVMFGAQSPHFHFVTSLPAEDFVAAAPVCSPADRYPTIEAAERMGPSDLKLSDLTTGADPSPRIRMTLTCPKSDPDSTSQLRKYEIYESVLKPDGSTATRTTSRDSCPDAFVLNGNWGDRTTITVAAIYYHTVDKKPVHSVCTAPRTITYGSALVPRPHLQRSAQSIEGTVDNDNAEDVLLLVNPAESYQLDKADPRRVHGRKFSAAVELKTGFNRIDAVARRKVHGSDAFSEPAAIVIQESPTKPVELVDLPAYELTSQIYVSGTAAPVSPVTIAINRGTEKLYETTLHSCANGDFGSDIRFGRLAPGAYTISASSSGSKQPAAAEIHINEIAPAPAISVTTGPGPLFVNGTAATIEGQITPHIETAVSERYDGDSTEPTMIVQNGSAYGLLASVNGKDIPFEPTEEGTFTIEVPLQSGVNTVRLKASTILTGQESAPVEIRILSGRNAAGTVDLEAAQQSSKKAWEQVNSNPAAAASAFEALIAMNPRSSAGYNGRAAANIRRDDAKSAFDDASHAVELDPRDFRAWSYRANFLLEQGRNEEAEATATRAIELEPTWSMPYENRAAARLNLGRYTGAIADASKAIGIAPKNAYSYRVRALAYHHSGHGSEALEDTTKALEIEPDSPYALSIRAQVLTSFGSFADVIETYTKLIAVDGQNASGHYNSRGWAKYKKGDFDGAIADATRSIELKPTPFAYGTRAWARNAKGDSGGAFDDLLKAKTLDPSYSGQDLDQGLAAFIRGDDARAVELWEKALAADAVDSPAVTPLLTKARQRLAQKRP